MDNQAELKAAAAIFTAAADGKRIEWQCDGGGGKFEWVGINPFDLSSLRNVVMYPHRYRIKPEPKTRPWSKPEDVPLNCWLKWDGNKTANWFITCVTDTGIGFFDSSYTAEWAKLQEENAHYSTDRKTWHKCEVVEEVQP